MKEQRVGEVGSKAEDFVLKDHRGEDFRLSACKGTKVLLSFHPLAWTDICAAQMNDLERNREHFERLHTLAVGISVDSSRTSGPMAALPPDWDFSGLQRGFPKELLSSLTKRAGSSSGRYIRSESCPI